MMGKKKKERKRSTNQKEQGEGRDGRGSRQVRRRTGLELFMETKFFRRFSSCFCPRLRFIVAVSFALFAAGTSTNLSGDAAVFAVRRFATAKQLGSGRLSGRLSRLVVRPGFGVYSFRSICESESRAKVQGARSMEWRVRGLVAGTAWSFIKLNPSNISVVQIPGLATAEGLAVRQS